MYRVVRSSDHGDLSRRNPFDHASLSNEETRDVKKELDEIDKKFDGAEELNANTINNYEKSSQLMTFRRNMIQLRMIWKLRLNLMFLNLLRSMLNK